MPHQPLLVVLKGDSDKADEATKQLLSATPTLRHEWAHASHSPTGAVDKARCRVASLFMKTDFDPLVMVDADTRWRSPEDIERLVDTAMANNAHVGAFVPKRALGFGVGCRPPPGIELKLYSDQVIELGEHEYVGGALTATPRAVFASMIRKGIALACTYQRLFSFFLPTLHLNPNLGEGQIEYLSEDQAFCHYARLAGHKVLLDMKPATTHSGQATFRPEDAMAQASEHYKQWSGSDEARVWTQAPPPHLGDNK